MNYHEPVLWQACMDGLNIKPNGVYADLTFGGGGHAKGILGQLGRKGRLLAFDQDADAKANLPNDSRITFIHANFRYLKNFLKYLKIQGLDGIIADLGISSHQVDEEERGFSFSRSDTLDMRMNTGASFTAESILNNYPAEELLRIFRDYGEVNRAHAFVKKIEEARSRQRIRTSGDLVAAVQDLLPPQQQNKMLARLYQALRIEVNDEMGALREMLLQVRESLVIGGRLVVLSYHSLEDRLVKNLIRSGNLEGKVETDFFGNRAVCFKAVNRSVITASEEEIKTNSRARSAKLRIAERIA